MSAPETMAIWQLVKPSTDHPQSGDTIPGRFELSEIPAPALAPGEVLVEIAGCGVCREDLEFFSAGAQDPAQLMGVLGHAISGTVIAGDQSWLGREVLVTAISDPGEAAGKAAAYSGFASHIPVAVERLVALDRRTSIPLEHMAAVAGSVAVAYQAVQRAAVKVGDRVIVVGINELTPFLVQFAKVAGAGKIIMVGEQKTTHQELASYGVDLVVDSSTKTVRETSLAIDKLQSTDGKTSGDSKIFETTGERSGCQLAENLLGSTGKLIFVGPRTVEDGGDDRDDGTVAEIVAAGQCSAEDYSQLVELVGTGRITLSPFIQTRPMSWIEEVFVEACKAPSNTHIILTADDIGLENVLELKSCR